ncbi:MFS transporter [Flammeovirga kamogawensis]|uniref:MFS transporter n=1 Tax=Flammeovirga kamogawensis TaxID=373891 RepID=A0ABX8GZ48_9BACT|nr:MFS transporter [Flammeovirga kamogawensis]MBB6459334.1 MFS family permease [Flammeovirga kamogawensis]QWG08893.1 MFS transporter [Flammeovirga kamogawensis]TRX67183.1 MFS transporter [Flammeovirga kamogawensis]
MSNNTFTKDLQYWKFCSYGFLKNLQFFDAFLLLFLVQHGLSYTQVGFLYALRKLVSFFLEIPTGILADQMGRKQSLILGFMAYICSFLMMYFLPQFHFLIIAFCLYGLGETLRSGTHKAMIMSYLEIKGWLNYKTDYYGHTRGWSQRGSAVSALLAGAMVYFSGNIDNVFIFSTIPFIINTINLVTYPSELNKGKRKKKGGNSFIKDLWSVLQTPHLIKIITNSSTHSSFLNAIKDFIQPIIGAFALTLPFLTKGTHEQKIGLTVGVTYTIIYIFTTIASVNSAKFGELFTSKDKPIIITLYLGLFCGLITGLFYIENYLLISIVFFTLIYIIENIRKPMLTGYISDDCPTSMLATILSVQSFVTTIVTATLSFVFGVLSDHYGIGIALIILSVGIIITISLIQFIVKSNTIKARE